MSGQRGHGGFGSGRCLADAAACAAWMIPRKSSALRLAPPTRAPSMSGRGEQLAGVVGLDAPPVLDDDPAGGRLVERRGEPRRG